MISMHYLNQGHYLIMSFCCSDKEPEFKYELATYKEGKKDYQYFTSLEDIEKNTKAEERGSITKVRTQEGFGILKDRLRNKQQKFTDALFPPQHASLGHIEGLEEPTWKRITQLPGYPSFCLFDQKIQPTDVIAGYSGNCYVLSALAALAQRPDVIRQIFRGQQFNPEGIYKVTLRVNGQIEQIVVDDFIPVNKNGLPIFCQPNKKTGEIWVVILEKALAKTKGSYEKLNVGDPSSIFKKVTYAPSGTIVFDERNDSDKIWNLLTQQTQKKQPLCATTKVGIDEKLGLQKEHTYTIVGAVEFEDGHKKKERVVKLRNPWKEVNLTTKGNMYDIQYWNAVPQGNEKGFILSKLNDGQFLFLMLYQDFLHQFNEVHYCNLEDKGNFTSESLTFDANLNKKAKYFNISVLEKGNYSFEVNYSQIPTVQKQKQLCRSSILLLKKIHQNNADTFTFVDGLMSYSQSSFSFFQHLEQGQYVIYVKVDPSKSHKYPQKITLNVYSSFLTKIKEIPRTLYPNILREAFLHHATAHKTMEILDGKAWISYQMLFQKGGYAYIAIGNNADNHYSITLPFNKSDFTALHYKVKKPFKNSPDHQLQVLPGKTQLILVKVDNNPELQRLKFPPELKLKPKRV